MAPNENGDTVSTDAGETTKAPFLRVVRGNPTDDEVAALVAVVAAASSSSGGGPVDTGPRDNWGTPVDRLRADWGSPTSFINQRW
ncbi:acyl-CoA carboxylase subunit epsilon [Gordonia soli]|uniref:Acyl-CoA carboxylase epsilon subunit n=1 Tax=Gordonia soli NBRC 108243 TaxID=1223545 RepID=M0QN98_9ACTN|nr:acyl-CoA carboxylase subunit epsilon [Gordonia soli]GAC69766.1 hypothetical protein GS4_28_00140 [Gordonia soli NBRC 108243]